MDIRFTCTRTDEKCHRFMRLAKAAYDMIEQCHNQIESFFDWSAIHLDDHKGLLTVDVYTPTDLNITSKDICSKIIANSWANQGECNYEVTYIVGELK